MATVYFSFAISGQMFPAEDVQIIPEKIDAAFVREHQNEMQSCCNSSHASTLRIAKEKFGIEIPLSPGSESPKVLLCPGDSVVVMQVTGLPRLKEGQVYSEAQIEGARFEFTAYHLQHNDQKPPEFNFQ